MVHKGALASWGASKAPYTKQGQHTNTGSPCRTRLPKCGLRSAEWPTGPEMQTSVHQMANCLCTGGRCSTWAGESSSTQTHIVARNTHTQNISTKTKINVLKVFQSTQNRTKISANTLGFLFVLVQINSVHQKREKCSVQVSL